MQVRYISRSLKLSNHAFSNEDCLGLTKCLQRTAETLHGIGELYDSHVPVYKFLKLQFANVKLPQARKSLFVIEESLQDVVHPAKIYEVCTLIAIGQQSLTNLRSQS